MKVKYQSSLNLIKIYIETITAGNIVLAEAPALPSLPRFLTFPGVPNQ